MDTGAALDAFALIDHNDAVLIHGDGVYRTALLTWAGQICNRVIRTGLRTFAALLAFIGIDIGTVMSHGNSTEITGILACLSHTLLAVVGYDVAGDGAALTCGADNLHNVLRIFSTRT